MSSRGRGLHAIKPSWMLTEDERDAATAPAVPGGLSPSSAPLPPLHSIHRGTVSSITEHGCFVNIPGFAKAGLLHPNQTEGHVEKGNSVWVLVTSCDEARGRYGLTNVLIDQTTGENLDPDNRARSARTSAAISAPILHSIHRGKVQGIREFGAFVELDKGYGRGLVHISRLADFKVDQVGDVVREGDKVWVKVTGVEVDESGRPKIGLSLKAVNQDTGADLDPTNVDSELDSRRRGGGDREVANQLPPVRGDLIHRDAIKLIYSANDVSAFGGSKKFDLIPEPPVELETDEDKAKRREKKRRRKEEKRAKKRLKKEHKKEKKARKKEKKARAKLRDRASSSSSSSSGA